MYLYVAITKKLASRAHAGLLLALSDRFSLHSRPYKIHRKKWVRLHVVLYMGYHMYLYVAITKKLLSTRLCTKHIVLDICPMMLYEAKLMMGYDELMMGYDAL